MIPENLGVHEGKIGTVSFDTEFYDERHIFRKKLSCFKKDNLHVKKNITTWPFHRENIRIIDTFKLPQLEAACYFYSFLKISRIPCSLK